MHKRLSVLVFLLVLAVLVGGALVGLGQHKSAHAATCTPIPGGGGDTAVVINPTSTVSGTIDATGCDFGVYVGAGHRATIANAVIFGANYSDVGVDGNATITGSHLYNSDMDIEFGVFGQEAASGTISNNSLEYIDNGCGIEINGSSTATITSNRITGPGTTPEPFAIVIDTTGGVVVSSNTITNNNTGILIYEAGSGSRYTSNALVNNTTGIEDSGTNSLISSNRLSTGVTGIDADGTNERILNNVICGYTTPIDTTDATNPTVSGNVTNC